MEASEAHALEVARLTRQKYAAEEAMERVLRLSRRADALARAVLSADTTRGAILMTHDTLAAYRGMVEVAAAKKSEPPPPSK